jgi:hypothetical protein
MGLGKFGVSVDCSGIDYTGLGDIVAGFIERVNLHSWNDEIRHLLYNSISDCN